MRSGPDHDRAAGFSLVEMLVVLAIVALAAGLGIPSIRNIVPSQRLSSTAERVASEIALLRTEAQRTGHVTRLVFDGETNRFVSSRPGAPALAMAVGPFSSRPARRAVCNPASFASCRMAAARARGSPCRGAAAPASSPSAGQRGSSGRRRRCRERPRAWMRGARFRGGEDGFTLVECSSPSPSSPWRRSSC